MLALQRTVSLGYVTRRPTRAVLIVVIIALGVTMLVATRCLDDSLHQAAKGAINPFATLADLLVSNGQTGVPADLAERLRAKNLPGLADVQPLVMGRAFLVELDDVPGLSTRTVGLLASPLGQGPALATSTLIATGSELDDQSVRLIGVKWSPDKIAKNPKDAPEANAWGLQITPFSENAADIGSRYWWDCVIGGKHPVLVGAELADRLKKMPSGADYFQLRRGPEDIQNMASLGTVHLDGPAHVLEDEAVFTDVYAAASIIYPQRPDYCTQLNLKLTPGADKERVKDAVQQFLKDEKEPGRVQTVEANMEMATEVTGSLELGFSVGGYLALLVGMFLVYMVLSVSVVERRRDIGILRSVGATRGQIIGLFLSEGALLGLTGSLLGLPLGYGLAWAALKPMQQVLSEVFVKLPDTTVSVSTPVLLLAVGAGTVTALLASLVPALQAAEEQPIEAVRGVRGGATTMKRVDAVVVTVGTVGLLFGLWIGIRVLMPANRSRLMQVVVVVFLAPDGGGGRRLPTCLPAHLGSFVPPVAFMGAVLVAMPLLIRVVGRACQPLFRHLFGVEGRLAADNLVRSPNRTGLVVASLAATAGLLLQTAGFTHSTEVALNNWIDNNVAADLYVTAGSGISKAGFALPMDARVGNELIPGPGRTPPVEGVMAVLPVRYHYFTYHDEIAYLVAAEVGSLRGTPRDNIMGGAVRELDEAQARRRPDEPPVCLVSDNFAALHHVGKGDRLTIPGRTTPSIDLNIIDTVEDYSYNRGTILVDYGWYSREFADDQVDVFDVYLKPGVDAHRVQTELTQPGGWARKQAVFVERRDELRDAVTRQLEQIYHLAYAQEIVVGLVALLGVVSALIISVLQRRRELGLLRAVGASRGQILRSVLAEASLMGAIGAVLGVLIGLALEWYTVRVMVFNEAGIVFPMLIPWTSGLAVIGGSVLAATLAGLWPAWRATQLRIPEAIAYE